MRNDEGYAPYGYGPPDDADDDAWERRQYGDHELNPPPAPYAHDPAYIRDPAYGGEEASPDTRAEDAHDAASDAAARAANAAQDVRAAESAP